MSVCFYLRARQVLFSQIQKLVYIALGPEVNVESVQTLESILAAGIIGWQLPFVRVCATWWWGKCISPLCLCLPVDGYRAQGWEPCRMANMHIIES